MRSWLPCTPLLLLALACGPDASPGADEAASSTAQEATAPEPINPMIALHEQGEPLFGLYAPRARPYRRPGDAPVDPSEVKSPQELAAETVAYEGSDYVFNGSMEGGVDEALPEFRGFVEALMDEGATVRSNPLVVKMEKISEDPDAEAHVDQQLDAGVSGVMFVQVESADELRRGLDAMRFTSHGGTRSEDDLGMAPAYWGLTEEEYRQQADLWPLNPDGELVSWVIVESLEGLENIDAIASVPGITVLWPGAGTLRGVFSSEGPDGERVVDMEAWENAIQTVLTACDAHGLLCGFPSSPDDIEERMEQGFDVFVMNWGDSGFRTIDMGHELAGR